MSWRGRLALVTGADGFIGSHLVERLVREGARVRAFVFYNSLNSWGWLDESPAEIRSSIEVVAGDIRDTQFVNEAARECEVVFHLAALIGIPFSYQSPEAYVETNVRGTLNVLNAARAARVARLVHTSTSEVYGTPRTVPVREEHPLQAQSPYAATKIGADQLALSYQCSFDMPVTILRPFNTYGPRQSARAVLPTILAQLLSGRREVRLGSLEPRRDLTYVADTVEGFLQAAESGAAVGQTIQLGTGRAVSIGELFELARKSLGVDAVIAQEESRKRPEHSEVAVLRSDPSRARELLGWEPAVDLEEGLRLTAEWMRPRLNRYKVDRYNV